MIRELLELLGVGVVATLVLAGAGVALHEWSNSYAARFFAPRIARVQKKKSHSHWWLLLLTLACALACTDEKSARAALEAEGMTDIVIDGWDTGCSDSDTTSTAFHATNARGKKVEGVVCCGAFLKGCTVRWGLR